MTVPDPVVDQILFRWQHGAGLRSVASSLPRDLEDQWSRRLDGLVRLEAASDGGCPDWSLGYYAWGDGLAAVIRRSGTGTTVGRHDALALIGAAQLLTPPTAVLLSAWPGWTPAYGDTGAMRRVPDADLRVGTGVESGFLQQARGIEDAVTGVLAQMLRRPGEPVSVIDFPPEHQLGLVWGLRLCADDWLRAEDLSPSWTFSTWEVRHDASVVGLPEIVFLPARPASTTSVNRVIIDRWEGVQGEQMELARQLVGHGLFARPAPVRAGKAPARPETAPARIAANEQIRFDDLVLRRPVRDPDLTTPQLSRPTAIPVPEPYQLLTHPLMPAPRPRPRTTTAPDPAPDAGPEVVDRLVTRLMAARTVSDFGRAVAAISAVSAATAKTRSALRDAMTQAGAWAFASEFIETSAREELVDRLVAATFGSDGGDIRAFPAASRDAIELIGADSSALLAQRLGEAGGARTGRPVDGIEKALADRYLVRLGSGALDPTLLVAERTRWTEEHQKLVASQRQIRIALGIVILFALVAAYLLGKSVGA